MRQKSNPSPARAYPRNAPKFWKMTKNVFSQLEEDLFWLKIYDQEAAMRCNFKISNDKVDLVTYPWKDLPTTRIFLIYLSFFIYFKKYQPWTSHSIKTMQLKKKMNNKKTKDSVNFKSLSHIDLHSFKYIHTEKGVLIV